MGSWNNDGKLLREMRPALEKRYESRVAAKEKGNVRIAKVSAGVQAQPDNLVLVKEAGSALHHNGRGDKMECERWTGPWEVKKVLQEGLSVGVDMERRQLRRSRVSTALVNPFHWRPNDLRHPIADEFAPRSLDSRWWPIAVFDSGKGTSRLDQLRRRDEQCGSP